MKRIKYRGEYYTTEVVKSDDLNYDDAVCINGVKGMSILLVLTYFV